MPDREHHESTKGRTGFSGARTMGSRFGAASRAMVALVLSAALALGLCPSWAGVVPQAQAADATGLEAGGFTFDVVDGAAYVKRTSLEGTVVIPSTLSGYPVKGVKEDTTVSGAEFVDSDEPVSIVLPEGLESIGEGTFSNCYTVESVSLPSTLESVGSLAFYNCSLRSIEFPESVREFGSSVVSNNRELTKAVLPSHLTEIPRGIFSGCESLTDFEFPSGVTTVNDYAFQSCGFTELTIPASVTSVGAHSFSSMERLERIVIPGSITTLPSDSFRRNTALKELVICEGVTVIEENAFEACLAFEDVYLPASLQNVDATAFDYRWKDGTVHYAGTQAQWEELMDNSSPNKIESQDHEYIFGAEIPDGGDELPIPMTSLQIPVYENGVVTVRWDLHLSVDSRAEITGYEVMRRQGLATEFQVIARVDASTSFYTDTNVEPYQTYNYTVRAVSGSRVGPYNERGVDVNTTPLVDTIMLCGEERQAGEYSITFRSSALDHDITRDFYYTEDFFRTNGRTYNHELAKMSLGLVASGFSTHESDKYWSAGTVDGVGREDNVLAAYETLGFDNPKLYAYASSLNSTGNKVACSFARKTFSTKGAVMTVVPVVLRGGGYGAEWSSNFVVSAGEDPGSTHYGFRRAAEIVYEELKKYLAEESEKSELGTVKLWIVGYSRAAATANLLTAKVCNHLSDDMQDVKYDSNVFAYTFATPAALTADEEGDWSWDYNQNISETLLPTFDNKESCIHNIIYSGDIAPRVPLDDWGFYRNGIDYYLPATRQDADIEQLNAIYRNITGTSFDFSDLATTSDVSADENAFATVCGSVGWYRLQYQDVLSDILQYANTKNVLETGTDVSKMEKIADLDHIDLDGVGGMATISTTWVAAKAATSIVIGVLGADVDSDELVPYVTIGMLHGLTPDVVGVLLQLAAGMLPGLSTDGLAEGHYPEVYMSLMEYFDEADLQAKPTQLKDEVAVSGLPFGDVAQGAYYADPVAWAVANDVTTGTSETTFSPDVSCTRAQALTFLWRACGSPEPLPGDNPFIDVPADAYYRKAVLWASQNGITTGTSVHTFSPDDVCTRAQVLTFQWRVREKSGGASGGVTSPFGDVASGDYFYDAVSWAVGNGITVGTSPTSFSPHDQCTRGQIVTFLYRDLA